MAFGLASNPKAFQGPDAGSSYKSSACSDMIRSDLYIVVCSFWDKTVIHWPPVHISKWNPSNPYVANCFNKTLEVVDVTVRVCENDDFDVFYWPKELWPADEETIINVLSVAGAGMPRTPENVTDELLFETTLEEFIDHREKEDPADLIWKSDGCTHAPDNPVGINFLPACQRHDFGYRNYRAQDRMDKAAKKKINKSFKAE